MRKGLVVGLDLSLNSTGVCFMIPDEEPHYFTFVPKAIKGNKKLEWKDKYDRLMEYHSLFHNTHAFGCWIGEAEVIAVEDYSYSVQKSKTLTGFGEQRGILYLYLAVMGCIDNLILVNPSTLKKFTLGVGRMDKEIFVHKVALKYKQEFATSDECDAFALCKVGEGAMKWKSHCGRGNWRDSKPKIFIPDHLNLYETEALLGSEFIRKWIGVNKKGQLR